MCVNGRVSVAVLPSSEAIVKILSVAAIVKTFSVEAIVRTFSVEAMPFFFSLWRKLCRFSGVAIVNDFLWGPL